ncbi:hypothetical protein WMF18_12210 [Sorangium sp. So ce315]|uniref:hypothetical protein n=1 Tax=Sorangium sp. So ce315 TaxID=3133299 RepID=UPI003F63E0E3
MRKVQLRSANVDERADPLLRALAEQPADLLRVQEIWLEEHWQNLVAATASTLITDDPAPGRSPRRPAVETL